MDTESPHLSPPTDALTALAVKILVKTVLRSAIWLGLAWAISYFFPPASWAWYVAFAFIAIGLVFSLVLLGAAMLASKADPQSAQGDGTR